MSKKRKDRLLLNLLEGKKHKHRVAMVNEEGKWNQHEPNSGMARMFVIMLLIHVVVIGGIIIYDFMNGDEAAKSALPRDYAASESNALPAPAVTAETFDKQTPVEEYATYEWRSGDSLPTVAQKLNVTEAVLIKLNMLDKGTQIDQHTILRYPRRPVVKAVALNVTPSRNGSAAKISLAANTDAGKDAQKEKDGATMNLTPPSETFSLEPTLLDRLTPAPTLEPGRVVQDSPPAAKPVKNELPTPAKTPAKPADTAVAKVQEKIPEKSPEVVKAVPVPRPVIMTAPEKEKEKEHPAPQKKIADSPPAPKPDSEAKAGRSSTLYVVKPGETLYRIAAKHGVSVAALQKANKITKPELLRDGMKLVIPAK